MTFKNGTFKRVRTGISGNITKYLEITAVMGHIENPVNGMVQQFNFLTIIGPILFLKNIENLKKCEYI